MKIIDLLNKIANGEEVPEFYYDNNLFVGGLDGSDISILGYLDEEESLNDEVEIIEEEKEIEKLLLPSFEEFKNMTPAQRYKVTAIEYDRLNEIIDIINDMRDKEC